MSAIVYISEGRLIELHRLMRHKEMNFWRLNDNPNFTNFEEGDILFLMSKDKKDKRGSEKGIVGFGVARRFEKGAPSTMWERYKSFNGYNRQSDFYEALLKVSGKEELPKGISSIYLDKLQFFQDPVYLSDCGIDFRKYTESFIYLDERGKDAVKILEKARNNLDLWSSEEFDYDIIEKMQILAVINGAYDLIKMDELIKDRYRSTNDMRSFLARHKNFKVIKNSLLEAYALSENNLTLALFKPFHQEKGKLTRIMLGQAALYKQLILANYPFDLKISFVSGEGDKELEDLMNSI